MLELIRAGGWPMIPLLLLSALALAIIVERFWSLRRERVLPPGLGDEVRAWVARGKSLDPAHVDSLRSTAPLGALLDPTRDLNTLGTIASAGPLLGLFGTVVGMIEMFLGILDHGIGDANQLAGGIGKALVCTATGMLVAIPALAFHRYFRGRIAGYIVDMEHEAIRLMDVLDAAPAPAAPGTNPAVKPG